MSDKDPPKHPFDDWSTYDQYWRTNVGAFQRRAEESLTITVEYAQIYLKSMLLLNGGAIFIVPAFAEHMGSLWATGWIAPMMMIASFVLGIAFTVGALVCAFYEFLFLQQHYNASATRMGLAIDRQYKSIVIDRKWIERDDTPSKDESSSWKNAFAVDKWARRFGWACGILFIFGALMGVYIIGCGADENSNKCFCRALSTTPAIVD